MKIDVQILLLFLLVWSLRVVVFTANKKYFNETCSRVKPGRSINSVRLSTPFTCHCHAPIHRSDTQFTLFGTIFSKETPMLTDNVRVDWGRQKPRSRRHVHTVSNRFDFERTFKFKSRRWHFQPPPPPARLRDGWHSSLSARCFCSSQTPRTPINFEEIAGVLGSSSWQFIWELTNTKHSC